MNLATFENYKQNYMKKITFSFAVLLICSISFGQTIIWGGGSAQSTFADSFIQSASVPPTLNNTLWVAQTVSDNSGATVPGNAYWTRTLSGFSQGINSDGIALGSPTQANGAAIFDSDYLDNGGMVGNEGNGSAPSSQVAELISPSIDLTGYSDTSIAVSMFLKYSSDSLNALSLSLSTDGGVTWPNAVDLTVNHANNHEGVSSAHFATALQGIWNLSDCRLKFTFDGSYNYVMVDDLNLYGSHNWGGIPPMEYEVIAENVCGSSYTSPSGNHTWTTPGIYYDTIQNQWGVDSVRMTIHLNSLSPPTTGTDTQSSCEPYTWIDGNVYSTSNNTATDTLVNAAGCDSIVTLNLTINTVDATATLNGATITANASGATYQWLDCDNGNAIINGETGQSYVATANGNYAVVVTENGCTDTSSCQSVTTVGLEENSYQNLIEVYPNPSSGDVNVDFNSHIENAQIQLTTITGEVVFTTQVKDISNYSFDIDGATGMYFLQINSENINHIVKIMKK